MKQLFLVTFASILLTTACMNQEAPLMQESGSTIPIDEAVATLNNALSGLNPYTKSGKSPQIAEILTVAKSDVISTASDGDIAYVVNFTDNDGFALLAADRNLPDPIIAIVENGTMDKHLKIHTTAETKASSSQDTASNFIGSLLNSYILHYGRGDGGEGDGNEHDDIISDDGGGGGTGGGGSSVWTTYETINPMVPLLWGQHSPFNNQCPTNSAGEHKPAGCVPVATALIMTYNRTPANFYVNGHMLDWDEMWDVRNCSLYDGSSIGQNDAALLIRSIGVFCDTFYTPSWSFTFPQRAKEYLAERGYPNATKHSGYDEDLIIPMLQNNKPVWIAAISGLADGHAWVIDGLMRQRRGSQTRELLHCNWGWSGQSNGYFVSGVFKTTERVSKDITYGDRDGEQDFNFSWWYRIITY